MSQAVLAGIKVVEYCNLIAGPYCAKLLADLGAEVVKIEQPPLGDESRRRGPFYRDDPHPERSGLFMYVNTSKMGVTLNLGTESGKTIFREIAGDADILVESYPPGYLEGLGLGYEALSAANPRLVVTSITPFGQTGPYKDFRAYHLNTYQGSGLGWDTWAGPGSEKHPPIQAGGYVADYHAGLTAATGTLAALSHALASGEGQHVDVSEQEAALSAHRGAIASYYTRREVEPRGGSVRGAGWAGELLCKDGWVWIQIPEEHQWRGLVELMGNPAWTRDPKFATRASRMENAREWEEGVTAWMLQHTKDEVYHGAQAKGVPIGVVYSPEEVCKSKQLHARGYFQELEHPQTGKLAHPTVPYRLERTPARLTRHAPLLGEHNQEVLGGRLGYSDEDLIRLREAGVI